MEKKKSQAMVLEAEATKALEESEKRIEKSVGQFVVAKYAKVDPEEKKILREAALKFFKESLSASEQTAVMLKISAIAALVPTQIIL